MDKAYFNAFWAHRKVVEILRIKKMKRKRVETGKWNRKQDAFKMAIII